MKAFRRLTLLGSFAVVGVGLAVCVGLSGPEGGLPRNASSEKAAERPTNRREASGRPDASSAAQSGRSAAPYPVIPAPSGPQLVLPYPAWTQQFVPQMQKSEVDRINAFLQHQLDPRLQAPASDDATPVAPMPGAAVGEGGAGPGTPGPDSAAEPPVPKTVINGEGDGQLSIYVQGEDIRRVLELLGEEGNLNILASKSVQGQVFATLNRVDIDSALRAILRSTGYVARREGNFVFVGTPEDFVALEQAADMIATRVYRPNYVTAAELQTLITPLLTQDIGVASVSSPAEVGIPAEETSAGGDSFAGAEVVVVRDYEAVLAQVDQLVREVDVRPLQVHIEAIILSVKLKDEDSYGVDFELLRQKENLKFGWGEPLADLADFSFEEGALKVGFLDSNLGAFLNALESIGDTNVIATPRLMVVNKHQAGIQIGDRKGYVSTTVTETTATQTVEFLEVGTILRLRPFISSDGIIRMEIHPELSTGDVTLKGDFTVPEKAVTQVTSNVMVRDGCTVVLGGLMREELATTRNQIPLFGNLPLIGFVFRSSTETTERREVLVLITPHIVYEPGTCREGEHTACEFHRRQSVYADKMTCFNKRSLGRKYFRLAQNAWAAGDRDRALRFAELSVHFDPLNRSAIDLRSDIWLGRPRGDHTLDPFGPEIPLSGAVDSPTMPEWLLNELEYDPVPQPSPLHPWDPGQPGPQTDLVAPRRLQ